MGLKKRSEGSVEAQRSEVCWSLCGACQKGGRLAPLLSPCCKCSAVLHEVFAHDCFTDERSNCICCVARQAFHNVASVSQCEHESKHICRALRVFHSVGSTASCRCLNRLDVSSVPTKMHKASMFPSLSAAGEPLTDPAPVPWALPHCEGRRLDWVLKERCQWDLHQRGSPKCRKGNWNDEATCQRKEYFLKCDEL